jgi:predicted dehydrogenase
MLEEVESMAVDLCLPTDLHRSQAQVAFDHGRHVFCEKPLALTSPDAEAMVRGAEKAGVFLMVGHCLRFWPEYRELERLVRSREFGALKALTMRRSSGRPDYAANNWTADSRRCLGAALDLHIHDADFLHHLLGLPRAVTSRGVRYGSGWDHIETLYDYGGPCVSAGGGWDYPSRWGFRMEYHATFEGGALNFDSCLSPALHKCAAEGRPVPVKLPAGPVAAPAGLVAYAEELDYFCVHIASGVPPKIANGVQAAESLRLVLAEIQSAETGQTVKL